MNPQPPHPQDLDQRLRDAARDRQATLDRLAPAYPVSDYPQRSVNPQAAAPSPRLWIRTGGLLGLGTVSAAALFGLVTLIGLVLTPEPNRPSPPLTEITTPPVSPLQPPLPSIHTLAAGLAQFESDMQQRLTPSVDLVAAWPSSIQALPEALLSADQKLQQPMKDELAAVQADLQTAARYLRQRWVRTTPTGAGHSPGYSPDTSPAIG